MTPPEDMDETTAPQFWFFAKNRQGFDIRLDFKSARSLAIFVEAAKAQGYYNEITTKPAFTDEELAELSLG